MNNYKMYNFNFTENPFTAVYVDANKTVIFDFDNKMINIYQGKESYKSYKMMDIPVSEGKCLLSLWERVLLELPTNDRYLLFELYNYFYDYKNKCKSKVRQESDIDLIIPETSYYFSNEDSDLVKDYMQDIILNSIYNDRPIGFFIDFQNQKIRVYYEGEKKLYTFNTLPKKYYIYVSSCLVDVENYLMNAPMKLASQNPSLYMYRESMYSKALQEWKKFRVEIETYLNK